MTNGYSYPPDDPVRDQRLILATLLCIGMVQGKSTDVLRDVGYDLGNAAFALADQLIEINRMRPLP